ncbi:hypothetical protein MD484_g8249, partial [Candolleomyces efflorescens]
MRAFNMDSTNLSSQPFARLVRTTCSTKGNLMAIIARRAFLPVLWAGIFVYVSSSTYQRAEDEPPSPLDL